MKTNIIDNTSFPVRKVVSHREAKNQSLGVKYFLTLECNHEIGMKAGHEIPTEVRCYNCHKAAAVEP